MTEPMTVDESKKSIENVIRMLNLHPLTAESFADSIEQLIERKIEIAILMRSIQSGSIEG